MLVLPCSSLGVFGSRDAMRSLSQFGPGELRRFACFGMLVGAVGRLFLSRSGVAFKLHRAIGAVKLASASPGWLLVLLHGCGCGCGCCHQRFSVFKGALAIADAKDDLLARCIFVGSKAACVSLSTCRLGVLGTGLVTK
jgi:hypothetical protein